MMKNSISSANIPANNQAKLKREMSLCNLNNSMSMSCSDHLNIKSPQAVANSDFDIRLRKLETIVALFDKNFSEFNRIIFVKIKSLVTNQNEILIKRVDDLENKQNPKLNRSNSTANFSNTRYSDEESCAFRENLLLKEKEELLEWKKDIEFSIEKISEKVAMNNPVAFITTIEKKISDLGIEINRIRTDMEENYDQASILNKNFEKHEKSEKLINELITQISNVKTSNIKWQSEFLKTMNDFNEKFMNTEIQIDQLDKQDKVIHKKLDAYSIDLKRKETNIMESFESNNQFYENKLADYWKKVAELDEKCRSFLENNTLFLKSYKEEIFKIDNNIKALWDSFTLFTTSK